MKLSLTSKIALGIASFGVVIACGRETGKAPDVSPDVDFDKAGLLTAIADCALDLYRQAGTKTAALRVAVDAWAEDPSKVTEARAAWNDAMDVWQELEVFQFGPLAMGDSPGGLDLRDPIYSWPLVNRCAMEQSLVRRSYAADNFATTALSNAKGLAALEYMLFFEGEGNVCPAENPINAEGGWNEAAAEIPQRRREYAKVVVADLDTRVQALLRMWGPEGDDFANEIKTAGRGSRVYLSDQEAFNAISDGMFYLESQVKDMKVAKPAGIADCTGTTCPDSLESPWAKRSKTNVVFNVRGFSKLFLACDGSDTGLGFDDYLRAARATELADRMTAELRGIEADLDTFAEPSFEPVLADRDKMRKLYEELRDVTTDLKTEFVSVLDLELPRAVQGDND